MSALVALKLLVAVAALLWWSAAAVRSLGDFPYRYCQTGLPEMMSTRSGEYGL